MLPKTICVAIIAKYKVKYKQTCIFSVLSKCLHVFKVRV